MGGVVALANRKAEWKTRFDSRALREFDCIRENVRSRRARALLMFKFN